MSFKVVKVFEDAIADFFGAKYGVAVDCCTHALELCLRYTKPKLISTPIRTYISVPLLAKKLNIEHQWRNYEWKDYYYITEDIIDAAVLWQKGSYIPQTFMCLSFQFQKPLNLGRGGMILTNNRKAAKELKKMSYDGRIPDKPWMKQNIDTMGYHYYMTPETAEQGIWKLHDSLITTHKKWSYKDYPDLTKMKIFNV
jgi:dTDP-4-amino-4,6-dideoxygalactose transaminase